MASFVLIVALRASGLAIASVDVFLSDALDVVEVHILNL